MHTVVEELLLQPNRAKIRALREGRGWGLDDAFAEARNRKLGLSRNTLRTLELDGSSAGCRVSTLGEILRLYDLPRESILDLLSDEDVSSAPPPKPQERRGRAPRRRGLSRSAARSA